MLLYMRSKHNNNDKGTLKKKLHLNNLRGDTRTSSIYQKSNIHIINNLIK